MTLDEAWAEVRAAMPATARLVLQERPWMRDFGRPRIKPATAFEAYATDVQASKNLGFGYGDTPQDALHSLAEKLRGVGEPAPDTEVHQK